MSQTSLRRITGLQLSSFQSRATVTSNSEALSPNVIEHHLDVKMTWAVTTRLRNAHSMSCTESIENQHIRQQADDDDVGDNELRANSAAHKRQIRS